MKRNQDSHRDFWDNIKHSNVHIIGVPGGTETDKGPEKIFEEIIAKNFLNIRKETLTQVQEMQSLIQDKTKEEHAEIHINQTDKN